MRPRKGLTRTRSPVPETAGCHSVYPPLGYYHTFEKQMFGRALSHVFAEAGLELVAGLVEGWRPSVQAWRACSLRRGARPDPRVSASSSFREGRWSALMCAYHTQVRAQSHLDVSGMWGVAGFTEPPLSLTFPSCSLTMCKVPLCFHPGEGEST